MKKLIFGTIVYLFVLFPCNTYASNWEKQFLEKYISYVDDYETTMKTDSLRYMYTDEKLHNQFSNNNLEEKPKAEAYSYYINTNDHKSLDPKLKAVMILLLIEYDQLNPKSPAYSIDKFAISNIGVELLYNRLRIGEDPENLDPNKDVNAQKLQFVMDNADQTLLQFKQKGVDVDFYLKIADTNIVKTE